MATTEFSNQAHLYLGEDLQAAQIRTFASGTAAIFTAGRPNKASANEDAIALIPWGPGAGVLVVADGLGGLPAGEQASGQAIEALQESLGRAVQRGERLDDAMLPAIESANRRIIDSGSGGGTTLAVATIDGGTLRTYHAGDSVVVVCGQRGRCKLETVAHSPVGFAVQEGLIDAQAAMFHPERHLVSNIVGTPEMWVETSASLELAPRDTVLLASDGLADNLTTREIVERIRAGVLSTAAQNLVYDCKERMFGSEPDKPSKPDDMSFILFRLGKLADIDSV